MKEGTDLKRANPVLAFGLVLGLLGALLLLPSANFFATLAEWYLTLAAASGASSYAQVLRSPGLALPGGVILTAAYMAFVPRAAYALWRSYRYVRRRKEAEPAPATTAA